MKAEKRATSLSAFALGLIGLCFLLLLHEVAVSGKFLAELPRLFAGLLAPVPVAIFLGFCFAHRDGSQRVEPSPVRMSILLLLSIAGTLFVGFLLQAFSAGAEESLSDSATGVGPAIAESSVFTASILNVLFVRSQILAALLSGISIGLTVFVIFLS